VNPSYYAFIFYANISLTVVLQGLSITISIIAVYKYVRSKIILNRFLLGRWEGYIVNCHTNAKLDCMLIVTECATRLNKAYFTYQQIHQQEITVRGADELHNYDDDFFFIWNKKWKPCFFRSFHISYNEEATIKEVDLTGNVEYKWICDVKNLFTKPKLEVAISGNGANLKGILHKS
jgi:hypothetical protein